jgi:hypothetical protein
MLPERIPDFKQLDIVNLRKFVDELLPLEPFSGTAFGYSG